MTIPPFTAFDGKLMIHYGQAYVLSPECDTLMPEDAFAGQRNGLCGAAVPGGLFLVTGLHTGYVHLQVQVHHAALRRSGAGRRRGGQRPGSDRELFAELLAGAPR